MKFCVYCGQENAEESVHCQKCGAGFNDKHGAEGCLDDDIPDRLERVALLENEVQAGLVDAVLTHRAIPHVLHCYHDSALDGLFQAQTAWGAVLAPHSFREEILSLVAEIKKQAGLSNTTDNSTHHKRWGTF